MKFTQSAHTKGRIDPATWHALWDSSCISVDDLPAPNLTNPIHPVYARERFAQLTDAQYDYIRPATTLASKFITEKNYMGFWMRLRAGHPETRQVIGKTVTETYIGEIDGPLALMTRKALRDIAQYITWTNMDRPWSEADPERVAETFMDEDYKKCRLYRSYHNDKACEKCAYCLGVDRGVCFICGYRSYRTYNKGDLKNVHRTRGMRGFSRLSDVHLLAALEVADDIAEPNAPDSPTGIRVPDVKFHNIEIQIHRNMVDHIEDPKRNTWTDCEQKRFQFSLAATLVHELAHPFWYFSQKRCWSCFNPDPWLSDVEPRHRDGPEIGDSWEHWAFGIRAPHAGRVRVVTGESIPNVFQQHQWSYSHSTAEAGESDAPSALVQHTFILPVEWINAWFQQSTWDTIAADGRVEGRPSYWDAAILRGEAVKMRKGDATMKNYKLGTRVCTIEPYNHTDLVFRGGLSTRNAGNRVWVYGQQFVRATETTARLADMLSTHNAKQRALGNKVSKKPPRRRR
jgi:hypothetical protein